jgi:hypothetical protein
MNGGVLTKTTGANELASVTINGAEGAIEQAAKKPSFWGRVLGGIKWGVKGLAFLGSWPVQVAIHAGIELAWPRQHVGDPGVDDARMLAQDELDTFEPGSVTTNRLDRDEVFYRVFGNKAKMRGKYFSSTLFGSVEEARKKLALRPEWGNSAEKVVAAVARAGTLVYRGAARGQGADYPGKGSQVIIPNFNSLAYGSPVRMRQ